MFHRVSRSPVRSMASIHCILTKVCWSVLHMLTKLGSLPDVLTVLKSPAEAKKTFDYIVCCHKAIDQGAIPEQLMPAIDEGKSTIVIIQNGVGNEEPFRKAFRKTVILSCVVSITDMCIEHTFPDIGRLGWELGKLRLVSWLTRSRKTCSLAFTQTRTLTRASRSKSLILSHRFSPQVKPSSRSSRTSKSRGGRRLSGMRPGTHLPP